MRNDSPTEAEAAAEVADIDALVKDAGETIKRLNARKKALVAISQRTARRTAVVLHATWCLNSHNSGYSNFCNFETGDWADWVNGARSDWLGKAERGQRESGGSPEEYLEAATTMAPASRQPKIDEHLDLMAAAEARAMNEWRETEAEK